MNTTTKVALIGAGPGDPELLSLKAARLLGQADIIFYDALIAPEILDLAHPRARRVFVGKRAGRPSTPQMSIHEQIIRAAGEGLRVVRLKGGDPFIFGRGGEECMALRAAGIPYEVVPGITSGSAAATYAGVPLTYRALSQSVLFVTGHCAPAARPIDWAAVARGADTLVIYMGLGTLADISAALIRAGRSPATPALAVESATVIQKEVEAPLSDLATACARTRLAGPAVIIVGDVVGLRDSGVCERMHPVSIRHRAAS